MDLGKARRRAPTANRGLSLIEVLIVIAIAAILLGIGVPNMQTFILNNRLASATHEFHTALQFARSEAVRRQVQVTLVHGGAAGSGDWGAGWTMCVDSDRDNACAGEETLRAGAPLQPPLTLYGSANFANFIAFDASGRLANAGGGAFVICHGADLVEDGQSRSRAVLVNGAGRVRLALDANGDGVPEKDSGAVASCTNP
ncbi:MAG: GspH/FimT family pseudopilin [Burkholderiaceae bacterium]